MKRSIQGIVFGLIGVAAMVAILATPPAVQACGYGNSAGGQSFTPQRKDGKLGFRPAVTRAQAIDIVTNHLKRLNPNLHIGNVNDTGPMFEAQVLSQNNEVVQMLGVDKQSGRLLLLN